jgi:hypothetical protein
MTLQVSAFAGLVGQSSYQSGLWRPMRYLGRWNVENAAEGVPDHSASPR